MDWTHYFDVASQIVTMISAGVGVGVAALAVQTYRRNATLERARWASSLYDKFYKKKR